MDPPYGLQKTSFRYIKLENRWEQKADMSDKRNGHACGRVTNPTTGKEEVVVLVVVAVVVVLVVVAVVLVLVVVVIRRSCKR